MRGVLWMILACAGLFVTACAHRPGVTARHTVTDEGRKLAYRLFTPAQAPRDGVPLVVALHRFADNADRMAAITGFDAIAEREGFAVVYPEGAQRRFDFMSSTRDDVRAILAVIDDVRARVRVDESRLYVTGASNGGFMTYALISAAPERFAAAAPVMALMPEAFVREDQPAVPLLVVYGAANTIVPPDATALGPVPTLTTRDAVAYWREATGCLNDVVRTRLPAAAPADGTRTTRRAWSDALGEERVVVYTVAGGGHTWPGGTEPSPRFIVGPLARDWSASEVIWKFFQRFDRSRTVGP